MLRYDINKSEKKNRIIDAELIEWNKQIAEKSPIGQYCISIIKFSNSWENSTADISAN